MIIIVYFIKSISISVIQSFNNPVETDGTTDPVRLYYQEKYGELAGMVLEQLKQESKQEEQSKQ